MKLSRLPKYLGTLYRHPEIITDSKKYIFLISHMRSYSTLLSHLLGSSSDVDGYKENHLSYRNQFDLYLLRYHTQIAIDADLQGDFVLDKVLHNYVSISEKILLKSNVYVLFTVREPIDTMKSIINMGASEKPDHWYRDPEKVANYYIDRLRRIRDYAELTGKKGVFLKAESIIENGPDVVNKLSEWLELERPISTEYQTFKYSGQPWHGDPSKNIMEGKIVRKKTNYEVEIPGNIETRVSKTHKEFCEVMMNICRSWE